MGSADNGRRVASRRAVVLAALIGPFVLLAGACTSQEAAHPEASENVDLKTVVLPIEGMSCSACVARVKRTLASIEGVSEVQVNLVNRNARIRFAPSKLSPARLVAAVDGLGYQAGPPTEEPSSPSTGGDRRPQHRSEAR